MKFTVVKPGQHRPFRDIAREIAREWPTISYPAQAYLRDMATLNQIEDNVDMSQQIVLRFLSNAGTWRGETARRVKAELKAILKRGGK